MINFFNFLYVMLIALIISPIYTIFDFSIRTKKEFVRKYVSGIYQNTGIKIYRASEQDIVYKKNIIYLSNHRTFSDFYVDHIVTHYSSFFVSRYLIAFIIPMTYLIGVIGNSIFFFKRGQTNITDFENMVKNAQNNNTGNYIMVYPEGTRRYGKNTACNLKKGLIYYSFKNNCPIQFIITYGKDESINEKKLSSMKCDAFVFYSQVYEPNENFKNIENWYQYINEEWKKEFNKIYSKNYSINDIICEIDSEYIHDNNYPIWYNSEKKVK